MKTAWEPFTEPWRTTVRRTGSLALVIGLGVALYQNRIAVAVSATILSLWFALGGHFAEVFFRNQLRHRIGSQGAIQAEARLVYWFVAGSALYAGALATLSNVTCRRAAPWPWWGGGVFFVGLELVVHLLLRLRGLPSFYDGRG